MEKEGKVKKVLVVDDKEDSRVLVDKLNEKVAELAKSEEELRYLSSVLRAIRNIDQLIVRERDKTKLLKDACRILLKVREYRFVWVGLIEEGHKRVIPVARAGVEDSYLDAVEITWDDRQSGKGPTGTAIKTRKPDLIKNIPENPRTVPWREEALKRGYRSSASIPLIHGDKVYGALNVYSSYPDGFNKAELGLLVELSGDIGFALKAIERQEARQRAEDALRESEEKFRTMFELSPYSTVYLDLESNIKACNQRFVKMHATRKGAEGQVGRNISEFFPPADRSRLQVVLEKTVKEGDIVGPIEYTMLREDDSSFQAEGYSLMVTDENGLPKGVVGIALDITERKKAEEKKQTILKTALDGFWLANFEGKFIEVNDSFCEMVGYTREQLLKMSTSDIEAIEAPEETIRHINKVIEQGYDRFESQHKRKDGQIIDVEVSVNYLGGGEGQLFVFVRDITERKRAEEALRESEAFQSGLLANSPTPITVINADSSVRYVNPALVKLTGFSAEELTGEKAPYSYWAEESLTQTMKGFKKAMRYGGDRMVELFKRKNGERFWVEITTTPVRKDGKFQYLLASWVDITESKKAGEKLRDEATRHRILIDESSDGIVILDEKGKVYEANRRFAEMLGYTHEETQELNVWDWEFQYPREQVAEMVASIGPEGDHFETKHRRKDGTIFDVEISTNGAVYAGQKLIFCVCRDITERKRAEAALKESEEKYKTLVETTSDIIWEADEKGMFTFASPKIKDILGYEVDEVVGKKRTLDLIPKGEARKWLKRFKELSAKREPFFGLEIPHIHKNGNQIICEISGIPLFDSAGELKGYVGIDKDTTERRQMQEQMVITDRLASVGELAAGIAHELNNPLTGVIGFSQLLMDKEMPEDIKEDIEVVYREAQRASQVVKNLLTFARKHTAAKEKVNINNVINKVLELRAYEQRVDNVKVKSRLAHELPEVMADYFQLQQVFLNIIINAEHFMKEAHNKGTLTVTTEQVGNKVRASFADDGPGIGAEDIGHLFDPFFSTKEVGSGTGLGLSICHGIIAEHGGRIYAESELGKGATFIVELPVGAAKKKGGAA